MANKTLFKSLVGKLIPAADARNEHNAPAYALTPKQALAQYAATGCLGATFYAGAEEQLAKVLELCELVEPEFVAKTAVYARRRGLMKDMPALLLAVLAAKDVRLLAQVFPRVVDNGKMLRNFVQIVRSGVAGRKSLGSAPKRLVREWLEARDASHGLPRERRPGAFVRRHRQDGSPEAARRGARGALRLPRRPRVRRRPDSPRSSASSRRSRPATREAVPDVPFQMLTALDLGAAEWTAIARRAPWQMTRMNLNTFARHGVFAQPGLTELIAKRLADPEQVRKARVFPYQLMVAYASAGAGVPAAVREALQDAMEVALENVPRVEGKVFVCPDVSGSMQSPVTGYRKGSTSAVRCVDVAALVAAAVLRRNPTAEVLPFEHEVVKGLYLNPRDSVMTNAQKLAAVGGGGTNCSAPLRLLNEHKTEADLVLYVSDNESWVDAKAGRGTETMREWARFKQRNPRARMVCVDVQPYQTVQASESADVLNVGGFSDHVFELVADFAAGRLGADHWVGVIEQIAL